MRQDPWDKRLHGLEIDLRVLPGVKAARMSHPCGQSIDEHEHELHWLSIHVLGTYTWEHDGGEARMAGPSVVLHPAAQAHANHIASTGLETVSIQFDPAWFKSLGVKFRIDRTHCWMGGHVAAASRTLANCWTRTDLSEQFLADQTARFLVLALHDHEEFRPRWLDHVLHALEAEMPPPTYKIARQLDLHPAWMARAYRAATGEGLAETVRRKRVERATALLRDSDWPTAQIAVEAGFCDQSHMNRSFRALLGRTPCQVRAERDLVNAKRI